MAKRIRPSSYLFPIGMLIEVDNSNFDPNVFYCNGKWERIKGKVIVGVDENDSDFNVTGKTGGSKTHTLIAKELPSDIMFFKNRVSGEWSTGVWGSYGQGYSSVPRAVAGGYTDKDFNQPHNNLQPYYTAYIWKLVSYS